MEPVADDRVQLARSFRLPAPPDRVFAVLTDAEQMVDVVPGATLTSWDGVSFAATVRLRIGPVGLVGQGVGRLRTRDARARRAVVEVTSRDGDEVGTVTITVTPAGAEHSTVAVHADLRAPRAGGRLGRSVVTDVGNRMVHRASTALAARLGDAERVPAAADGSRVMRLPRLVLPAVAGAATVTAGITVAVVRRVLGRR